jgi:hypothetical protein
VSVIYDTFRKIERNKMDQERTELNRVRTNAGDDPRAVLANRVRKKRPFKVLTVTSNKGGVGKTTISTNLAVYFRALREDLPILILGMDDQSQLDRMFALDDAEPEHTVGPVRRSLRPLGDERLGSQAGDQQSDDPARDPRADRFSRSRHRGHQERPRDPHAQRGGGQ